MDSEEQDCDDRAERFERLFRSTLRRVTAYCLRRTDRSAAHDAVSEVYAVAWRRRARLPDDDHQALLWLLGVARNVLANQARSQRRWFRLLRRAGERAEVVTPAFDTGTPDLDAALAALSDADREVLRLAYWDDLSHDDIAAVLGIGTGAVTTRLHRARQRLRPHLTDSGHAHDTSEGELTDARR
ncbi:RNA polymerase sigma factor [Streptomyces hainanensis]|uniref:Sigma-70 family RNA polymerase sigma factor n=1 Tax=Streptomyces hainanensis TaxID=402648 RepID=A0A4R4SUT5_9ACTN|nr:sigma-70 family RNA polymerase sigma factor [Streptomyces hainanensis]TDC67930.1 sigma-70 family RNA polymerase sigma factor [Streptomyces hainanensis]